MEARFHKVLKDDITIPLIFGAYMRWKGLLLNRFGYMDKGNKIAVKWYKIFRHNIGGLVQDCRNYIANAWQCTVLREATNIELVSIWPLGCNKMSVNQRGSLNSSSLFTPAYIQQYTGAPYKLITN